VPGRLNETARQRQNWSMGQSAEAGNDEAVGEPEDGDEAGRGGRGGFFDLLADDDDYNSEEDAVRM
jgi:hypothetical protein